MTVLRTDWWGGQVPLLTECPQEAGLTGAENPLSGEPVSGKVLSLVIRLGGPFPQVPSPGSPERCSPRKKTRKAAVSAVQLPRVAPQEDKVRRLDQG